MTVEKVITVCLNTEDYEGVEVTFEASSDGDVVIRQRDKVIFIDLASLRTVVSRLEQELK